MWTNSYAREWTPLDLLVGGFIASIGRPRYAIGRDVAVLGSERRGGEGRVVAVAGRTKDQDQP